MSKSVWASLVAALVVVLGGVDSLADEPENAPLVPTVPLVPLAPPLPASALAAAESWAATGKADWPRVREGLLAAHEVANVPIELARATAVAWYLETHGAGLDVLADAQEHAGADDAEVAMLRALAAGARREGVAMAAAIAGLTLPHDAYSLWVESEVARQSGDPSVAFARSEAALTADPEFHVALLSRAAARIALGRPADAIPDVEHLRRVRGEDERYRRWIDALERRVR